MARIRTYAFTTRTPRPRRARVSLDQIAADCYADTRQPASDIEVVLPNPGNKLISHLGTPIAERNFTANGMKQRECTLRLPRDWRRVDEVGPQGQKIVARQDGTERLVAIEHPEGPVSMSEVWY